MGWGGCQFSLRRLSGTETRSQFLRFLLVGLFNTFSSYLYYLVALWWGASAVVAYNISYLLSIFVTYFIHLKFTFQKRHTTGKMLAFPLTYVVQYSAGLGALMVFLDWGVSEELAGLLIIIVTVPITFLISRFLLNR